MSSEIFTEKKKRNFSFIFHAHVGGVWGCGGVGGGFDLAYSVSLLLNSKRVTKPPVPWSTPSDGSAVLC